MVRAGLLAAALAALLSAGAARGADPPCFWIHGRLTAANGAPTFRIWRTGTRRVFAVSGDVLPRTVQSLVQPDAFQVEVHGDFQVCPLTPDRPGRMRLVRLKDARNLIARPSHPYAEAR